MFVSGHTDEELVVNYHINLHYMQSKQGSIKFICEQKLKWNF